MSSKNKKTKINQNIIETKVPKTKVPKTKITKTKITKKKYSALHKRNIHRGRYNFILLVKALPELNLFLIKNANGEPSINFSDDKAVKMLNKALLALYYKITVWDIPKGYLCPPLPGRADYLHHIADLLACKNSDYQIKGLDIGTGANCVYPIVAVSHYNWSMIASDIDPISVSNALEIVNNNPILKGKLAVKVQTDSSKYFSNIIDDQDRIDFTMCNPPFHASLEEAHKGARKKLNNLAENRKKRGGFSKVSTSKLNFGGQKAELWCSGGEQTFIRHMALESQKYADKCLWFTTLVSKKENVRPLRKNLEKLGALEVRIVEMTHGQKITRFVAWTFLTQQQQDNWFATPMKNQ